jgi:APA family basic amino acid/polyamine antiporter
VSEPGRLARRLGTRDAVVIGLGSMLGAGVFTAFTPAADAAGSWLLVALLVAGFVAYCNATSTARLAALHPESGGAYVYGRRRLGDFWGYLAGWSFVVGKTASCAAMALTVGLYAWPSRAVAVAVAAVVACMLLNLAGVHRSALVTRAIVASVVAMLAAVVAVCVFGQRAAVDNLALSPGTDGAGIGQILQAAGFLFFAFAGYARIATLGEEVRDPSTTIPRAIRLALAVVLVVYLAVGFAVLAVLGADGVAGTPDPLARAVEVSGAGTLAPVVRVAAVVAALGSLLALILGVTRTTFAMARDRHLPFALAAVSARHQVPHRAELVVGGVVVLVVLVGDVRGAIGFSSFAVLVYYAVANASALTLARGSGRRWIPVAGLVGCVAVAASLPVASMLSGLAMLSIGAAAWGIRRRG